VIPSGFGITIIRYMDVSTLLHGSFALALYLLLLVQVSLSPLSDEPYNYPCLKLLFSAKKTIQGFRFGLRGGGQSCLNLYFMTWTLNSPGKVLNC